MTSMATDHACCGTEAAVSKKPCALLWDESLLWGVMAWRALREAGLPFDLLRSEDVRRGALSRYRMIFVPGGWASNKLDSLGERGKEEIRRFVAAGGSYLGICGGAGMATEDGLGLLPVRRKPSRERVPSFSGPILLSCGDHPIWHGIERPLFNAWWPSQLMVTDRHVRVLARYEEAQADAFSSDVKVADGEILGWSDLEERYGILLDPERLRGEPAVLEGQFRPGEGDPVADPFRYARRPERRRRPQKSLEIYGGRRSPRRAAGRADGKERLSSQRRAASGRRNSGGRCGVDRRRRGKLPVVVA